jgi:hypothetical protein
MPGGAAFDRVREVVSVAVAEGYPFDTGLRFASGIPAFAGILLRRCSGVLIMRITVGAEFLSGLQR